MARSAAAHDNPAKATVEGIPRRIKMPPAAGNNGKNGYSAIPPTPSCWSYQSRAMSRNHPPSIASNHGGYVPPPWGDRRTITGTIRSLATIHGRTTAVNGKTARTRSTIVSRCS